MWGKGGGAAGGEHGVWVVGGEETWAVRALLGGSYGELGVAIERTRELGRARSSEGEGEARASTFAGCRDTEQCQTRCSKVGDVAVEVGHATSMHGGHVGILSSMWRATVWVRWAPILG
jgi:hypothetical protein